MTEKTKKKPIPKSLKIAIWNKYFGEEIGKGKCLCCNITDITQLKFHAGHIISENNGGETNIDNLRPICEMFNKSMRTKNMDEFKNLIQVVQVVEEVFSPNLELLKKVYIDLRIKCNNKINDMVRRRCIRDDLEEVRILTLSNINEEFIKLLADESKISAILYTDLLKYKEELFLSSVLNLISKIKYNNIVIEKIYKYLEYKCAKQISGDDKYRITHDNYLNIQQVYKERDANIQLYTKKEFIELLCDDLDVTQNYDELLKYEKELFLSTIQNLISKNKYNMIDINKYIEEYDKSTSLFKSQVKRNIGM